MVEEIFKKSSNTPPHLFRANAVYMITGSTYQKQPHMNSDRRKQQWLNVFQKAAELYDNEVFST
jgi:hypothetical protein